MHFYAALGQSDFTQTGKLKSSTVAAITKINIGGPIFFKNSIQVRLYNVSIVLPE